MTRYLRITPFLIASSTSMWATAADIGYSRNAASINLEVTHRGAKAVVNELFQDQRAWNHVLKNIESGDGDWVAVAANLAPGTDAGSAETLDIALFYALEKSPALVLAATTSSRIDFVCSDNFMIDAPADQSALRAIQSRILKLNRLSTNALLAKRDSCVKGLREAEQTWRHVNKDSTENAKKSR